MELKGKFKGFIKAMRRDKKTLVDIKRRKRYMGTLASVIKDIVSVYFVENIDVNNL
ncbi:MAG: hypothetical protein V3S97_03165 [Candidatus Bathyarchaeia archaeon]